MGYSTHKISTQQVDRLGFGKLVATNDIALTEYLDQQIKIVTIGREYGHDSIVFNLGDNNKIYVEYGYTKHTIDKLFAEIEL